MDFQKPYNRESFLDFIELFLPEDLAINEEEVTFHKKYYKINKVSRLGQVDSLSLSGQSLKVYEVEHESEHDPRVTLTREFFSIMRDEVVTRALIIFHSSNTDNYRLSFMTVDYRADGKKVDKEFSNPKRYSFYLGPDAKVVTPSQRLLLEGRVKDMDDLQKRFAVDVVTDEFFEKYKKLYERLVAHLDKDHTFTAFAGQNGIDKSIFAKKLLGQIVFIYFLQKKGWLGAARGEAIHKGDKNFFRSLFIKCQSEGKNFFNDYLEYLFYDALNKQSGVTSYRERFDCQIPFLNGGLFEPLNNYNWEQETLPIPNEFFSDNPDKPENGNGILDVFDSYNFTVDENTAIDQEVSVDPEMLGKVFEKLLDYDQRKGKGAFYTPREIVYYMCRESLVNYLITECKIKEGGVRELLEVVELEEVKNKKILKREELGRIDKALEEIRAVDPACGSGAFLVGMLNEIVHMRVVVQALMGDKPESEYRLKKQAIQECIYGVDIDPGAIDIAKLRFWLSLIVDHEIDDIEPLPNLDYKLMQGNSLLEDLVVGDGEPIKLNFGNGKKVDGRTAFAKAIKENKGYQAKMLMEESDGLADRLVGLHNSFFDTNDPDKKRRLKQEIDEIENSLIVKAYKERINQLETVMKNKAHDIKLIQKNTEQILAIKKTLNEWRNDKLRPFFPWRLHFGEVFRNKDGFGVVIGNPPYIRISSIHEAYDRIIRKKYRTVFGHYDMYIPFMEKAFDLAKKNGIIAFITPNKYLTKRYANKLRPFLLQYRIISLLDLSQINVFESASVYSLVSIFSKQKSDNYQIKTAVLKKWVDPGIVKWEISNNNTYLKNDNQIIDISIDSVERNLFDKIDLISNPLRNFGRALTGTPAINLYYEWPKIVEEDPKEKDNKLKIINVSSLKPYSIKWGSKLRIAGSIFNSPYINFDNRLIGINKWEVFKKIPKILIKGTSRKLEAALDEIGYANVSLYAVVLNDKAINIKALLGLLNSNLLNYWYTKKFASNNISGNYITFNGVYIEQLPISINFLNKPKVDCLIKNVEEIIKITSEPTYDPKTPPAEQKILEDKIDNIVYGLYGLTKEDIKIIKESFK